MAVFNPPPPNWSVSAFRVNWEPPTGTTFTNYANALLDGKEYRTEITYDALNRVKLMRYPQDVSGNRKELRPRYNSAGALERIELDSTTYVERIAYNAKGQRTLIAYGNGIITRYAYDTETFRLVRLRTEKYNQPEELTYRPTGAIIQDFAYQYDLVGNITAIQDRTPASGIINNPQALETVDIQLAQLLAAGNALIRRFTYDPIYRLLSATGRECDKSPETPPWVDAAPRCTDLTRTRSYTQRYEYDAMGNVLQLQHQNNDSGFNRKFEIVAGNNQLANMTVARTSTETNHSYTYDVNGNLIQENSSRYFEWDHSDQMKVYRTQTGNAEPSVHAHYLYDAGGQRVKKLVRKQGGEIEVTVYIDGVFEERRLGGLVNNVLHVMDNTSRIALVRVGNPFPDDNTPAVKYQLGDHLGSSNVVISGSGDWVNREEFTPYGETSFGSFRRKRYRFTGKERDEESGLNYHGARYYAPWLARWESVDSEQSQFPAWSPFCYSFTNPIRFTDFTGNSPDDMGSLTNKVKGLETEARDLSEKINNIKADIEKRGKELKNLKDNRNLKLKGILGNVLGRKFPGLDAIKLKSINSSIKNKKEEIKYLEKTKNQLQKRLAKVQSYAEDLKKQIEGLNPGKTKDPYKTADYGDFNKNQTELINRLDKIINKGRVALGLLSIFSLTIDANYVASAPNVEEGVRRGASVLGGAMGAAILGTLLSGLPGGTLIGIMAGEYLGSELVYHADSVFSFVSDTASTSWAIMNGDYKFNSSIKSFVDDPSAFINKSVLQVIEHQSGGYINLQQDNSQDPSSKRERESIVGGFKVFSF